MITLTPRVDPLIAGMARFSLISMTIILNATVELITGTKTADIGVKNAMMKALQEVVGKAGANMSDASKNSILALIDDDASDQTGMIIDPLDLCFSNDPTDAVAITNAKLLGALVKVLPAATAGPLIKYATLGSPL